MARAVSPPQKIAASATRPIAPQRRRTIFILPRSMKGTKISATIASAGRITAPTTFSGPSNHFTN